MDTLTVKGVGNQNITYTKPKFDGGRWHSVKEKKMPSFQSSMISYFQRLEVEDVRRILIFSYTSTYYYLQ